MYESYIFIPGNRLDIISNINNVEADYKIIDFEDSVSSDEILSASKNLLLIDDKIDILIRFSFFIEENFNSYLFDKIIKLGFRNFVIPKINNVSQLIKIREFILINNYNLIDFNFLLLVESPLALMSIKEILNLSNVNIIGVALGSYDYCLEMNMEYNMKNISWARNFLLNILKAYRIKAIDIVSMEIKSTKIIRQELLNSLRMGFDGKLFIHPSQIKELVNVKMYSDSQIDEAYRICSLLNIDKQEDINVFVFEGKVYEKPHILRMINIINWHKKYGK